jgi:ABC-type molybdate transport system substrate-binding protein
MTIIMDRRSLLRWMAVAGAAGPALSLWPKASRAQHHHDMTRQAPAHGDETLIFAAATLKPALDEIVRIYRDAGGAALNVAYGPTPMLAKNIADGAPADIFFSADGRWMDYLSEHKLIRDETRAEIVKNELVLIKGGSEGHPVTVDHDFPIVRIVGAGPLAMCNPDSHPAGRYGKASLQELGLWDAIAAKIVIAETPGGRLDGGAWRCARRGRFCDRHPRREWRHHRGDVSAHRSSTDHLSGCGRDRRPPFRGGDTLSHISAFAGSAEDFRPFWVPMMRNSLG